MEDDLCQVISNPPIPSSSAILEVSTTSALSSTADPISRAEPVGLSLTFLTGVEGGLIRGSKLPCPSTYEMATRNLLPT